MANTPRFCPVCHRPDVTTDAEGRVRAVYPPTLQAMLPLTTPKGQVILPDGYGVCEDCHAKQYAEFYRIENTLHPRVEVEDIYALLPPLDQVATETVVGAAPE